MARFKLAAVSVALLLLSGCTATELEGTPTQTPQPTPSSTEATAADVEDSGASSKAELIDLCSDALYYWYPDGTYNHRFSTDRVSVEGDTFVFHNNLLYGDYNDVQANDEVRAYYDALVEDNDADIWCVANDDDTFDMGIADGISVENMTMEEAQEHRLATQFEITRLSDPSQ